MQQVRWLKVATLMAIALASAGCVRLNSRPKVPPDAGIWRSLTKGEQWEGRQRLVTAGGVGSLSGVGIEKLFFDPQDPRALYLTAVGGGLAYTYDAGETWQQLAEVGNGSVSTLAVDPRQTCTVYLGIGNRALKTTDCSRSYKEIYLDSRPIAVSAVAVDARNSDVVYVGTSSGDLLRSANGGGSWSRFFQFSSGVQWLKFDPQVGSRAYLLTAGHGLFRSVDGLLTWQSLSPGLTPYSNGQHIRSLQFVKDQPNTIFLLNLYGLLRSADGGDSWQALPLITPPLSATILVFTVNPIHSQEIYYATASTFYASADGGVKWVTRRLPGRRATPTVMAIHPLHPAALYLGLTVTPAK